MYFRQIAARLLGIRDDIIYPAVCFNTCNKAGNEALSIGLTPALCNNSSFLSDYDACYNCIVANSNLSSTDLSQGSSYDAPSFAPYIEYCATNISANPALQSEYAAQESQITSLLSELALLQSYAKTVSVTQTPGPASLTSSPSPTPASNSTSHTWIAGVVIGPVLLILAIGVFLIRRQKQRHISLIGQGVDLSKSDNYLLEKAQLHADSIVRHELDGEEAPKPVSELPVLEPVGSELAPRI